MQTKSTNRAPFFDFPDRVRGSWAGGDRRNGIGREKVYHVMHRPSLVVVVAGVWHRSGVVAAGAETLMRRLDVEGNRSHHPDDRHARGVMETRNLSSLEQSS